MGKLYDSIQATVHDRTLLDLLLASSREVKNKLGNVAGYLGLKE